MARRLIPRLCGMLWPAILWICVACSNQVKPTANIWEWGLPKGVPPPHVPASNPMSPAKVLLGRYLFYDKALSEHGTLSCASCHHVAYGLADPRGESLAATGGKLAKNAPGLVNVAYYRILTWANPTLTTLEAQALVPLFADHPEELHAAATVGNFLEQARYKSPYDELFPKAFQDSQDPFTAPNIARALAAFERSLLSFSSPFDRYLRGEESALSAAAKEGAALFNSNRLGCGECHHGIHLTLAAQSLSEHADNSPIARNTGLYNLDDNGEYPSEAPGMVEFSGHPEDHGKFRIPSLRNIALTAPYMHDGSIATLDQVLDHYAAGGRSIMSGPLAGDGRQNPNKDRLLRGFALTPEERTSMLAFFESLTDRTIAGNPEFADPW
jgi:cytochrome c peroxidase